MKTFQFTKAVKAQWVAALQSGDFKQGSGELCVSQSNTSRRREPIRYCCLGVLAELNGVLDGRGMISDRYGSFPPEVCVVPLEKELIHLNDHIRAEFSQIANYIQANCKAVDE